CDDDFIAARTEAFKEFKKSVEDCTPEWAEKITGVPADKISEMARRYATAEKASIIYSMGITQHTTGTDNVLSLANLAMLTGNVGKESAGVNPLRGQNNVQGACDMGALPNVYPGYQKVVDPEIKKKFEEAWGVPLSGDLGLTVVEMMNAAAEGRIKGMYIMGENPMLSDPNVTHVKKALENLEFLCVQDIFLTETAQLADVIFPAASFAEKDGTFTNTERRVQRVRKAFNAPGEARQDWNIICDLAVKMGCSMHYDHPSDILDEIASVTPIYGGISFDRIEQGYGLQWPCSDKDHPGTVYLHKGEFKRGKGKFYLTPFIEADELPDKEYPYILTTGRSLYHFHTGTMTRRSPGLEEIYPPVPFEINPDDASRVGIVDGEYAELSTRRGAIRARAVVTERSPVGTVFMPFHFVEGAANVLTNDALDPTAKIPEYKACAVKVMRLERTIEKGD
ncbi:molybdopterin oxidoreductase family protein, partial [Verrucomicrobiota bacterium]